MEGQEYLDYGHSKTDPLVNGCQYKLD